MRIKLLCLVSLRTFTKANQQNENLVKFECASILAQNYVIGTSMKNRDRLLSKIKADNSVALH